MLQLCFIVMAHLLLNCIWQRAGSLAASMNNAAKAKSNMIAEKRFKARVKIAIHHLTCNSFIMDAGCRVRSGL